MCVNRNEIVFEAATQYTQHVFTSGCLSKPCTLAVAGSFVIRFWISNKMTDSIANDDDILSVWSKFPKSIRNDPCFSAFREEFESANGNLLETFIDFIRFFLKIVAFFHTADAFTVKNELLKPQNIGEIQGSADGNGQNKFTVVKHLVFIMIWSFVAWHLLTVKEKNLPKYDIVANNNQTKSKSDFQMTFELHRFDSLRY